MFNRAQFRDLIVRVLSEYPELYSDDAVELLLGTAAQESQFGTFLRQIKGPAIGAFQMEPNTFLWLREDYGEKYGFEGREPDEVEWDLRLAILTSRLRYRIVSAPLPSRHDVLAMGEYWDKYYNCNPRFGTPQEFERNYAAYVGKVPA